MGAETAPELLHARTLDAEPCSISQLVRLSLFKRGSPVCSGG